MNSSQQYTVGYQFVSFVGLPRFAAVACVILQPVCLMSYHYLCIVD